ncbi:Oocyte-specific histone RNA stem-loop-binding protein 2 [Boothiomyces macroporosus]|uniref:Oocyte-specific histone RNA stem-loop-binding protein 2 n=1 Tax=Boothiomyces macroporosus TaxID=261099 RepID=A0AAD5UP07_9FUNG|nr:Oocyte-specific histone RNA stem-loop-binding protein 2 [Boothiomyces macroporosus]
MKKLEEAISAPEFIPIQYDYQYQDWAPLFTSKKVSYQEPEQEDLLEKISTESEVNSVVESLFTQSSKGSGIKDLPCDDRRLEQRQKQIDYGKNTVGYKRYIATVPKHERKFPHPETPDKYSKCSKRAWDGLVRSWRRKLHLWDPPDKEVDYHAGSNR